MYEQGLADSPTCPACNKGVGSIFHRLRECPNTSGMRQGKLAEAAGIAGRPRAGEDRTDTLSIHGVDVRVPPSPPVLEWSCHEYGEDYQPEDQVLIGLVGTDGSMINPRPTSARRSGWSVVKCKDDGTLLYAAYGTCPDRCPTAHRAELVDCLERGRANCCDRSRKAADLWRKIWGQIDTKGGRQGVVVRWVKAHTLEGNSGAYALSESDRRVNEHADRLAGLGSAEAAAQSPCEPAVAAYQRQTAFYRCVTVDVHKDREYVPKVRVPRVGVLVDPILPHEPWLLSDGRGFCPRCRRGSRSAKKWAANYFFRGECNLGSATQEGDSTAKSLAVARTRLGLERRGATKLPARKGKRRAEVAVQSVDPWLSYRVDFTSVLDTRAAGLNPLLGGELWVNPRGGAVNVRKGDRGFTLCSRLTWRRAEILIEGNTLTLEGIFQVTLVAPRGRFPAAGLVAPDGGGRAAPAPPCRTTFRRRGEGMRWPTPPSLTTGWTITGRRSTRTRRQSARGRPTSMSRMPLGRRRKGPSTHPSGG